MAEVKVGQVYRDEDGKKWKVRAFSRRGWPVVTRFGYRTAKGIETNPAWFDRWTLEQEKALDAKLAAALQQREES